MLPILEKSLDRWQADYRIVERICKCLRFIIRFLSRNSGPILQVRSKIVHFKWIDKLASIQVMAERIVAVYTNHRHSCFLYLTSILVDEIGDNYSLDLQNLFRMLAEPTLGLLNEHDGLRNMISNFKSNIKLNGVLLYKNVLKSNKTKSRHS